MFLFLCLRRCRNARLSFSSTSSIPSSSASSRTISESKTPDTIPEEEDFEVEEILKAA